MAEVYMKQRRALTENERVKEGDLKYLNENRLPQFLNQLGLDLRAGDKTPESGGMPRLFILDEENPSRPRTL